MNRQQLADAMLSGKNVPGIVEDQHYYIAIMSREFCKTCALGAVLVGKFDGDFHKAKKAFIDLYVKLQHDQEEYFAFAKLLEIPVKLAIKIEHRHLNGQSIEQIAAWLKSSETEGKTS